MATESLIQSAPILSHGCAPRLPDCRHSQPADADVPPGGQNVQCTLPEKASRTKVRTIELEKRMNASRDPWVPGLNNIRVFAWGYKASHGCRSVKSIGCLMTLCLNYAWPRVLDQLKFEKSSVSLGRAGVNRVRVIRPRFERVYSFRSGVLVSVATVAAVLRVGLDPFCLLHQRGGQPRRRRGELLGIQRRVQCHLQRSGDDLHGSCDRVAGQDSQNRKPGPARTIKGAV
jgi:hypothetical protein